MSYKGIRYEDSIVGKLEVGTSSAHRLGEPDTSSP
jgi:hypothetical protein